LVEKGFHPNQAENGMHLQNKINSINWAGEFTESTFHGNHPAYTNYVSENLKAISLKHHGNPEAILNEVTSSLIPKLRNKINEAAIAIQKDPNLNTLNDYFKNVK
jgi:hypothetical protein